MAPPVVMMHVRPRMEDRSSRVGRAGWRGDAVGGAEDKAVGRARSDWQPSSASAACNSARRAFLRAASLSDSRLPAGRNSWPICGQSRRQRTASTRSPPAGACMTCST